MTGLQKGGPFTNITWQSYRKMTVQMGPSILKLRTLDNTWDIAHVEELLIPFKWLCIIRQDCQLKSNSKYHKLLLTDKSVCGPLLFYMTMVASAVVCIELLVMRIKNIYQVEIHIINLTFVLYGNLSNFFCLKTYRIWHCLFQVTHSIN